MSNPPSDVNFFDLLGLSPEIPWDPAAFERALAKQMSRWSQETSSGAGTRKGEAARNRTWAGKHSRQMIEDAAFRKSQTEAARASRRAEATRAQAELDAAIAVVTAKGFVLESEISSLASKYKAAATEAEIRRRIGDENIRSRRSAPAVRREQLPRSVMTAIEGLLSALGATDLYAFLRKYGKGAEAAAISDRLAAAELLRVARAVQAAYRRIGSMTRTAENDAVKELAGHCLIVFVNEKERAKYDAGRADAAFTGLLERVELAADKTGAILPATLDTLLKMAGKDYGLDLAEAEARIREYAAEKNWVVVDSDSGTGTRLWKCGDCNKVNESPTGFCSDCGKPATIPCPRCRDSVPSADRACGACGFPVGNEAWIRFRLGDVTQLMREGRLDEGKAALDWASSRWPNGPDGIGREIQQLRDQLQALYLRLSDGVAGVREAAAGRAYYEARRRLVALGPAAAADPVVTDLSAEIEREIGHAESLCLAADRRVVADDDAVRAAYRALAICSDCESARQLLARRPPSPPTRLGTLLRGEVVGLKWSPSPSEGVEYVVVRATGRRPNGPDDGRLARVRTSSFDDAAGEHGVALHYAVFAARGDVFSADAAYVDGAVVIADEVLDLSTEIEERWVRLTWTPPEHVSRVFALRECAGGAAARLEAVDKHQIFDQQLQAGRAYRYTVYCEFEAAGRTVRSSGLALSVVPQPPPRPIEDLVVEAVGARFERRIRLTWTSPASGRALLIRGEHPAGSSGRPLPVSRLASKGVILMVEPPYDDQWVPGALIWYTPVVVRGDSAHVGTARRIACLDEVDNVHLTNHGRYVLATWDWPSGCTEASVICGAATWPPVSVEPIEPSSAEISDLVVTRAQYEIGGGFHIPRAGTRDYYVIVRAGARFGGNPQAIPRALGHGSLSVAVRSSGTRCVTDR